MTDWTVREHPEFPGTLQCHPDFRRDSYPFRDDPRYLDREPAAIAGAIEVADRSELTFYVMDGGIYLGPDPDEVVHSWMRTFWCNVGRRTININIDLRGQRDEGQFGLEAWAEVADD